MSGNPRPPDHESFDALAVGYALHSLEPEDEAAFVTHLPGCAQCARTVAETHEVMAAMATDLPAAEPSEALRGRLRAAVEETEQIRRAPAVPAADGPAPPDDRTAAPTASDARSAGAGARPGPPGRGRVAAVALAAAAVAVAAVVGLGIWNVVLTSARDQAMRAAAEQSEVLEKVLQPGAQVMARMTDEDGEPMATLVTRDGEMQVVSQGLAVNDDSDQIYVLWGVGDEGPVALGSFDVERSRTDVQAVGSGPTGVGPFAQYAVSLEPGRQPPASPSAVLASGQVTN